MEMEKSKCARLSTVLAVVIISAFIGLAITQANPPRNQEVYTFGDNTVPDRFVSSLVWSTWKQYISYTPIGYICSSSWCYVYVFIAFTLSFSVFIVHGKGILFGIQSMGHPWYW
jgi:hypothetical protein